MNKTLIAFAAAATFVTAYAGSGGMGNASAMTQPGTSLGAPEQASQSTATQTGAVRTVSSTATMGNTGTKMVGGAAMFPSKDIVDNAVNSKDHTTLVAAVKAAGLVDTLKGAGPFTVFAPTNDAFAQLPAGTVDTLLKAENKPVLTKVLTYHVVPGRIDAAALAQQIKAGGGKATLKTASGGTLTASMRGSDVLVTDGKGNASKVSISDVYQSNGVIHVVDKVLLPG